MHNQMAPLHAVRKAVIRIEMLWAFFLLFAGLLPLSATGQYSYTLTINPAYNQLTAGTAIPYDFAGVGFEMTSVVAGQYGLCSTCNFFDPNNSSIVTLAENLSLRNIRVGGGTSDTCSRHVPSASDLSKLFGFAAATNLKVIYSLPLQDNASCGLGGSKGSDAMTASTIISSYSANLHSFEFGNEPDFHSYHTSDPCTLRGGARGAQELDPNISEESYSDQTDPCVPGSAFPSYYSDWLDNFVAYLPSGAVVSGPDQGDYSAGTTWTGSGGSACNQTFTDATWPQMMSACEQTNGAINFSMPTQHLYVGGGLGGSVETLTSSQALENMMSAVWATATSPSYEPFGTSGSCRTYPPPSGCPSGYSPYPWMNTTIPAGTRLTESNDFLGGSNGASNAFGSALWALDYMQWWASHGAVGVNFHNNPWLYTDTIVPSNVQWSSNLKTCPSTGCSSTYDIAPKGYGVRAFDLGGHGYSIAASPQTYSGYVDSFAVGSGQDLYVTIVNRSNSIYANDEPANVSIDLTTGSGASLPFAAASVSQMALTDTGSGVEGDLTQTGLSTSTKLGGAAITSSGPWYGEWTADSAYTGGSYTVSVPASTAMVVHFRAPSYYAGPIQINQSGALEMFATKGNTVYHNYQIKADEPASAPSDWNASGTTAWPVLSGVTATGQAAVIKNQDNTLEIFVPTSGGVYHNWQVTPSGGWNGWVDMGSGSNGLTDIQVGQGAGGELTAFGINSSGDMYYSSETGPRAGWSAWTKLGGSLSGGVQPGYVVAQNLNGRVEVFAADGSASPQIWHAWQTSSGPFTTTWATLTSAGATVSSSQLAVARNLSGDLEVFGLGTNGHVWHSAQPTPGGGPWSTWSELESGTQIAVQPGFAVGQDDAGDLVVFGVEGTGSSARVYYNAQTSPGGSYSSSWTLVGSVYTPGSNQIVVSSTADGRMQLFNIGSNGDVFTNWQTAAGGSGNWNGWSDFGSGSNGMSF